MIITVSNLYPRPDQPIRGMFNFQFFREMANSIGIQNPESGMRNVCIVPEWRVWRWAAIRLWTVPMELGDIKSEAQSRGGYPSINCPPFTVYLPAFYLPFLGRSINWWFNYRALRSAFSLFIDNSTAVHKQFSITILASWLYPDAVAVARFAKDIGVPVWLRIHGSDRYHLKNRFRRQLIMGAVAYAKGVFCNCKAVADDLVNYGVTADKIHIVENGVDTTLFRYREKEEVLVNSDELFVNDRVSRTVFSVDNQQPISDDHPAEGGTILFVGNLVPVKGPDILLKAFALLDNTSKLILIGSGPMLSQLHRLALKLKIAERVRFLGNRPHEEVAQWMNVADVLCLASRSEGMPNVVLEARASGLPVVTTPVGSIPELQLSKEHFLVVNSCSPEDLAEGLYDMLGRDLLNRKSDSAIPSWQGMAGRILGLIGER